MKKLICVFVPVLMILLFTQCQNDDNVLPDEMLIAEIENAQNKVNIAPDALPPTTRQVIEDEYFDSYVETCAHVPGKGYEVMLGNEDQLYFRENGLQLRSGPHGPHRPGPCGRGLIVPVEELPDAITMYVTNNYPDAEILKAKQFPRGYVLLITGRRLLIFNNDLEFVAETYAFHFCDQIGHPIDIANLPAAVTDYIATNYPDGEIIKAFAVRGRIVVGVLTPDGRKILVFDADGNFLFERG
ncbi:MAG TPA: PepSY-like domain-containing protein [Saprospiraceae bacterium]|nr:PepSY-like domain-containing protein [Saprospiraceae bacterium]